MQPDGNPRTGLWKRESKNGGANYYSGKLTIDGVEYWANFYKNDRQEGPKAPPYNLVLNPVNPAPAGNVDSVPQEVDDEIPF